ncbi:MAG TPA: amidohydrolase family protein [Candidatus Acidoferrum sp.]|nr:amidohydrolase family protein [Candidatus Acidoferrum sp.]
MNRFSEGDGWHAARARRRTQALSFLVVFLDTIQSMTSRPRLLVLFASVLVLFLSTARPAKAQHWSLQDTIVITDVNVVDVRTGEIRPDQIVIIEKNRITAVGPRKDTRYPRNAPTILNGKGSFLIPGLWDMHVHLVFGDWFPRAQEISLPLFVANGVTSVRDMGSELEIVQSWRNDIEGGRLLGPRIMTSGPMLDGPKPRFPSSIAVATPEDGRRAVIQLKQSGADFIKLQSLVPRDAVFSIAEEARKQEIPFEGHVPDSVRAGEMSSAGMHSFEHLIGIFEGSSPLEDEFLKGDKTEAKFLSSYDSERASALAALLAKNQTWQCPTLVWERGGNLIDITDFSKDARAKCVPAYWKDQTWKKFTEQVKQDFNTDDLETRKKFIDKELEVVQLLHKAGVPFLAGTDTPPGVYIFPGFSLHEELQRFVAAGFTPLEALQTATLNPARFFQMEGQLGTIEKGKLADLVFLDGNPLEDIRNTQKVTAVILNGQYLSKADLQKILQRVEECAKKEPPAQRSNGSF